MRPDGNALPAVIGIAQRMIEVIVRVERRAYRRLRNHAQRLQLKRRADRRLKSLDQQHSIAPDNKAAIRARLQSLGAVGNRRVDALADLPHRRKSLVHQRRRRNPRIDRRRSSQRGHRRQLSSRINSTSTRRADKKIPPRKRSVRLLHSILHGLATQATAVIPSAARNPSSPPPRLGSNPAIEGSPSPSAPPSSPQAY